MLIMFIITYIMADQQDEFFVEPEVQEVRDLQPLSEAAQHQPHQARTIREEAEHVHLKMVEIPKDQIYSHYQPFRFEQVEEQQSSEEDEMLFTKSSVVEEYYSHRPCVYQRFNNKQLNRVSNSQHFTGLFAHRKVLLEANCKETHELADVLKQQLGNLQAPNFTQKDDLMFDSKFESGNLFAAYKVSSFQYDLMMANDTNSMGGSNQWFYFSVTNLIPGKNYTFSIVNFTKTDSLFNYGMAPVVYSLTANRQIQNLEQGWHRYGKDITYKKGKLPRQNSKKLYYCLTFTLATSLQNDKLFIAHSYPYTYQKLRSFLTQKTVKFNDLITQMSIGKTVSKRSIDVLRIRHPINKKRDNRKAIIIMARQHPGQTQGSFVCQGVIDRLLLKTKQSDFLLKNYVVYVIPMVNPDGVVFGHYRCNLLGKDLNRKWNATQRDQNCPEVVAVKAFLQEISKEREIRFIIDLHGHSKKLNSFFYGNPCPENPQVVRIFPYVCSKLHQGIQFLDCTFATEQYKKKAARVYLSTYYHLIHVYTFQSSFYAYFQDGKKIQFTPKQYRKLGAALINALAMQLQHEIKYQQSFQFNLKQIPSKDYLNSPFVKLLTELKNSKILMSIGYVNQSGSDSKPEEGQLNNQQMESLKTNKQTESITDSQSKTVKISRRGIREARDHNYHNRPIRNIRFLEMSQINSVLPDRFQLALQPIRKKESLPQPITHPLSFADSQAQNKFEVKLYDIKASEIDSCHLNSEKKTTVNERRLSSLMQSMNNNRNNIIIKVEDQLQSLPRPSKVAQIHTRAIKNAFSQTMITFNKDQNKIRSSQKLPAVEGSEKQRYDLIWPKISQMNINTTMKGPDMAKETEILFNGMVKRFINEKQVYRRQQLSNRSLKQKALSLKKPQYTRK